MALGTSPPCCRCRNSPPPAPAVPKTRQITRWLLSRRASLDPSEQAQLDAIRARCPHLDALAAHVTSFAEMMTVRSGDRQLDDWLAAVEADHQPHLHSFAAGIRRDHAAVTAGLTLPYSSGAVEGNVNRIRCSNARCTAAPASPCYASASSFIPGKPDHGIRARTNYCVRGDLNTEFGEISPDRGNHAIRVTRPGRTHPCIPQRVRYLVRYLACVRPGGRVRGICSRTASYRRGQLRMGPRCPTGSRGSQSRTGSRHPIRSAGCRARGCRRRP
jgi:Transposase